MANTFYIVDNSTVRALKKLYDEVKGADLVRSKVTKAQFSKVSYRELKSEDFPLMLKLEKIFDKILFQEEVGDKYRWHTELAQNNVLRAFWKKVSRLTTSKVLPKVKGSQAVRLLQGIPSKYMNSALPKIKKFILKNKIWEVLEVLAAIDSNVLAKNINYFNLEKTRPAIKVANVIAADIIARFDPRAVENNIEEFNLFKYDKRRFMGIKVMPKDRRPVKNPDLLRLSRSEKIHIKDSKLAKLRESGKYKQSERYLCSERFLVKEHGRRRVEFLFFTFLAVYNDGYTYYGENPELQYGIGERGFTEGAHSTLTPNLSRSSPEDPKFRDQSFFYRHYLFHAINSTVELKLKVNDIDSNLEGNTHARAAGKNKKLRQLAYELINRVSNYKDDLTPEKAMILMMKKIDKAVNSLQNVFEEDSQKLRYLKWEKKGMNDVLKKDGSFNGDFFKWNLLLSISDKELLNKKWYKKKSWSDLSIEDKDILYTLARNEILGHFPSRLMP